MEIRVDNDQASKGNLIGFDGNNEMFQETIKAVINNFKKRIEVLERKVDKVFDIQNISDTSKNFYEFITHDSVRRQLELDSFMMNKSSVSDFHSFCQFATFQVENLLNYYYILKFKGDEDGFKTYFNLDQEGNTKKRISEIAYGTKFTKFAKEFLTVDKKPTQLNHGIQNVAYVRHSTIHRNSADIDSYEESILNEYARINKKSSQDRTKEEKDTFTLGIKIDFKRRSNFDKTRRLILEFIDIIGPEIRALQSLETQHDVIL